MSRNVHPLKPELVKIALLVAPVLIPVCLYLKAFTDLRISRAWMICWRDAPLLLA
jgi:hypothetical protein